MSAMPLPFLIVLIGYLPRWRNDGCSPALMQCWTTRRRDWWPPSFSSRSVLGTVGSADRAPSQALRVNREFGVCVQMLEWWYQSGEQKISAPSVYPPPPPPPPPKVRTAALWVVPIVWPPELPNVPKQIVPELKRPPPRPFLGSPGVKRWAVVAQRSKSLPPLPARENQSGDGSCLWVCVLLPVHLHLHSEGGLGT